MLRCAEFPASSIDSLLHAYGLEARPVPSGAPIPGSYWGEPEAGLIGAQLYYRADTPLHSLLHEMAHFVCMTPERRLGLHTDAGGDDLEEMAVCYLQVLLGERLPGVERQRLFSDMDEWGYSFRLGSAARWFDEDAAEALVWLRRECLVDDSSRPLPLCRGETVAGSRPVPTGPRASALL